jgi:hypothetical protein
MMIFHNLPTTQPSSSFPVLLLSQGIALLLFFPVLLWLPYGTALFISLPEVLSSDSKAADEARGERNSEPRVFSLHFLWGLHAPLITSPVSLASDPPSTLLELRLWESYASSSSLELEGTWWEEMLKHGLDKRIHQASDADQCLRPCGWEWSGEGHMAVARALPSSLFLAGTWMKSHHRKE